MSEEALLFAGDSYYPSGGWWDLVGTFDSVDDAKAAIEATRHEVTIPAQPARREQSFSTSDSLLLTRTLIRDYPAVPERIEVRYRYDWAHIVVDGKIAAEWANRGQWGDTGWSDPA